MQWDLFAGPAGGRNKGTRYLVRIFYDEKETAFKPSRRPVAKGSDFYDLMELERCYGRS